MALAEEVFSPPHKTAHPAHGAHEEHASPWPGPCGLAVGVMVLGLVTTFSAPEMGLFWLIGGTLAWLYIMTRWWREVSAKAAYERGMLDPAESLEYGNFKKGMLFFIASEVFFFIAFFEHLFGIRLQIESWGPKDYHHIELLFGSINTFILFASGFTMRFGHMSILRGNRRALAGWTVLTALMGSWFLGGQVWEYLVLPFSMKDGIFGTSFYVLTGFHGFHVFIGLVFIWVIFFRALAGHFTPERHFAVLAANWYWLFVDLIWILVIFPVFYILPRVAW